MTLAIPVTIKFQVLIATGCLAGQPYANVAPIKLSHHTFY